MEQRLKVSTFLKFWAPLALMQVIMSFEFPAIIAFISRIGDAKENLAIFTVVTSLSLLLEGVIIQMLSAATALCDSWNNYQRVKHFLLIILALLVAAHLFCILPGPFGFIATTLLKIEPDYIESTRIAFLLMLPWVPTIGVRRLWQGVLIRNGRTGLVSMITVIRIIVCIAALAVMLSFRNVPGCYVASIALSLGVTAGAISAYLFARPILRELRNVVTPETMSWRELTLFYLPLAMTSFVTEADRPIIAAGISRGLLPTESLAGWGEVISIIAVFRAICYSTQEASIALFSTRENNQVIKKSVFGICTIVCATCFFCIFMPPVREYILINISGLTPELAELCKVPLKVISITLLTFPVVAWLRAVNIHNKTTRNIGWAVTLNLIAVTLSVIILDRGFSMVGLMIGSISYIFAMAAESGYLTFKKFSSNNSY
ncbi:MAG: hypothetical protein IKN68_06075 [Spirochaetia bacterium]|nr:hypothetical protein [Spirochaetia bacterium]